MRDFHGDHADTVFARKFKYPGEALSAVALEGIGIGSGFVGTHPGANLSLLLKQFHHGFDIGRIVDRTQTRENMERVLIKSHTVVGESGIPNISGMAADPLFLYSAAMEAKLASVATKDEMDVNFDESRLHRKT